MVHAERLKFAGVAGAIALLVIALLPIEERSLEHQVGMSLLRQEEARLAQFDPTSTILKSSSSVLRETLERKLRGVGQGTSTGELSLQASGGILTLEIRETGTLEPVKIEKPLPTRLALLPPLVALVSSRPRPPLVAPVVASRTPLVAPVVVSRIVAPVVVSGPRPPLVAPLVAAPRSLAVAASVVVIAAPRVARAPRSSVALAARSPPPVVITIVAAVPPIASVVPAPLRISHAAKACSLCLPDAAACAFDDSQNKRLL